MEDGWKLWSWMVGDVLALGYLLHGKEILLNTELVEAAKLRIPSTPVLVNMVSKRVRQLIAGFRPYIKPMSPNEEKVDIALREIAEGKIIAEIDFQAPEETQQSME